MELLQVQNVVKYYRGHRQAAVDNINLSVEQGDIAGFLGANGAGKSTLVSMIATLIRPDAGDILYRQQSIVKKAGLIRKELGFVPQDIALFDNMSGIDNLKFFGRLYHLEGRLLEERINETASVMGLSTEKLNEKVKTYSGGIKRKVNIGSALLHKPKILIMDEPTVGVDLVTTNHIMEIIKNLNKNGTTVLYVGHYISELEGLCNKICIIDSGKILVSGKTRDLLYGEEGEQSLEQFYLKQLNKGNK